MTITLGLELKSRIISGERIGREERNRQIKKRKEILLFFWFLFVLSLHDHYLGEKVDPWQRR